MIQNETHQIRIFKKSVSFRKNISSLIDMYFKSLKEEGGTFSKGIKTQHISICVMLLNEYLGEKL